MRYEFVNHEIALKLEKLGFEEDCFDWFREEHNLMIVQDLTSYGKYFFNIKNVKTFEEIYYDSTECYDTFNKMMEKAVEKLIEIVENRNE